jgi:hypothetical protein
MVQNVFRKNAIFAHPDVFENVRMTGMGPHEKWFSLGKKSISSKHFSRPRYMFGKIEEI